MRLFLILISALLFVSLSCRDATDFGRHTGNHPPVVQDILVHPPSPVLLSSDVHFEAVAVDVDGDELTYNWSVSGGTITLSHENAAYWQPDTLGVHAIKSMVSDGKTTAMRTINIIVKKN